MKKPLLILFSALLILITVSCSSDNNSITVYSYDSFCSDWGPGADICKNFEEKTGIKVNLVSCGGAPEVYSKIIFEGNDCKADVVLGLSDTMNVDTSLFETWTPDEADNLVGYSKNSPLIPFDYGFFSFVYNSEKTSLIPESLDDLLDPSYKDKFVLIDPRTSTVGLGLYLWTIEEFGLEKSISWWKQATENALTVCSSWSSAYGLFTEGEVDIVISYSTSPVYHKEYENTDSIKAIEFKDGHIGTTEYIAVLKQSNKKDEAKKFCDFILNEAQNDIALSNTMFPANVNTKLSDSFEIAMVPNKVLSTDLAEFKENIDEYLSIWAEELSK